MAQSGRSLTHELAIKEVPFLLALHSFPGGEAEALGLPHADRDVEALRAFRDEVLPPLANALAPDEYRIVRAWWDGLFADPQIRRFTTTLRHGDLWYDPPAR